MDTLSKILLAAGAVLMISAMARPSQAEDARLSISDIAGVWKPMSADSRQMTIKSAAGKITISAPDMTCTLTDVQHSSDDPPVLTASSKCYDESELSYANETLTILHIGKDSFLVEAAVLLRLVNDETDPKVDERYTNRPAVITIYRRLR